jgi:DNA-directed RNA polymerase subunit beta
MLIEREQYGKIKEVLELPYLIEIQRDSYDLFLQYDIKSNKRKGQGLQAVFNEVFPIESFDKNTKLEFIGYSLGKPKYDILECQEKGTTYSASLKVRLRLVTQKDTKEQDVYLCELPLMTDTGTFVINGDERVVVSQLHRSPGVSFEEEAHPTGKKLFSARVIPYRGAWIEFEMDVSDVIYAFVDRHRRLLVTTLLRVLGYSSDKEILQQFYPISTIKIIDRSSLKDLIGKVLASDIVDKDTKEVIVQGSQKIDKEIFDRLFDMGFKSVEVFEVDSYEIINTLSKDRTKSKEDAVIDLFKRIRPGDPVTAENAEVLIHRLFFDSRRYDLGRVGRFILNRKLGMDVSLEDRVINKETIVKVIKYLFNLKKGIGQIDDIDHLGNRRVRTVGELLQNQFRIALSRLERTSKERMGFYEIENIMPHSLINSKLISSVVKDFFGRSQLSQFMDQTNPLAELTHKRRLSALGPGGLSRERAGFEVRDVHHSHYGRICPIETPEGPNIGLIASLSSYARVNEFGFIETPYRRVEKGRVTDKIEYLSADIEDQYIIAQANEPIDKKGYFINEFISCRHKGDFPKASKENVHYMDVSPNQLVSIAAGLIPFLEHDDANRALMGSNMQRQAVPLLNTEAPLVGTGMELRTAIDSGSMVKANNSGVVTHVEGNEVIIDKDVYKLRKFSRSNASTCVNQRPIVAINQRVKKGEVVADGPSTKDGELALGRNVLVCFMPWRGYNFEDAILISEKLIREDYYTSLHIEEFKIEARDTRLGNEEITRDIPNVSEEALKNLDESGMVRIGAEVVPGDVLVGKVSPKSETELSPEERLLRAIFGEKAGDVRDASLTVPPGVEGIVIGVRVFSRKAPRSKNKEGMQKEQSETSKIKKYYTEQIQELKKELLRKLSKLLLGKKLSIALHDIDTEKVLLGANKTIRKEDIKKLERCNFEHIKIEDNIELEEEIKKLITILNIQVDELSYEMEREIEKSRKGDELPAGVLKKVVVHIASKRRLSVGDKVAGRHGNKGVIAKILPEEDMPFMLDGTPIEIVLNPLGVPSRMNVGQILETHLGWAAKVLGYKISSPVFNGATETEIKEAMKKAGLPEEGKIILRDGFTGKSFEQKVCVGYIYMMKLAHLVDDKIHARSIGPYSLVTQQPLGGKAQFGGQRFGEMEVWALEAYGAAYTLQELLTVKSDDVSGRTKIYESIVKGEHSLIPGTPESFNVLVKELQSLALDIRLEPKKELSLSKG